MLHDRYKESITKSTRGWKERLFSRNPSVADIGSEVRREVRAGIATVTRMMERLDTRESRKPAGTHSSPHGVGGYPVAQPSTARVSDNSIGPLPDATVSSTASEASTNAN